MHSLCVFSRRSFFLFLLLGTTVLMGGCKSRHKANFEPGMVAPEIRLTGLDGKEYLLSSTRGKVVVLNFMASWCGPCIAELPSLERLAQQGKALGIEVLSVGVASEKEELKSVQEEQGISYPILVDEKGEVQAMYGINSFPETFVLDAEGKFTLFPDSAQGPVLKVFGERQWDSEEMIRLLQSIGKKQ